MSRNSVGKIKRAEEIETLGRSKSTPRNIKIREQTVRLEFGQAFEVKGDEKEIATIKSHSLFRKRIEATVRRDSEIMAMPGHFSIVKTVLGVKIERLRRKPVRTKKKAK